MREQYIEYRDGETLLEGFLCYDESQAGPRPTFWSLSSRKPKLTGLGSTVSITYGLA